MDTRHIKIKNLQEQQKNLKGRISPEKTPRLYKTLSFNIAVPTSLRKKKIQSIMKKGKELKFPQAKRIKKKLLY